MARTRLQHRALVHRPALHETPQLVQRHVQQPAQRLPDQRGHGARRTTRRACCWLEQPLRAPVVADHAPAAVERQQVVGVHVEELRRLAQPQHPVAAVAVQEGGVLHLLRTRLDQLQRQVLALLGLVAAELRDVEHGVELAKRVVDRRAGAGQRDVRGVEVVVEVDGERLARAQAGADAAGARVRLAPVGAEVQARLAQARLQHEVAEEIHRHPARIRQQHDIAQPGDLLVQRLQPVAGDVQEGVHLLLVLAQPGLRQDDGLLHPRRVEPVFVDAALPARADDGVVACGGRCRETGVGHLHHRGDVGAS